MILINKLLFYPLIVVLILAFVALFFDKALSIGFLFLFIITIATFAVLHFFGIKDTKIYIAFWIIFAIHLSMVLLIYFTGFRPFGGGADFEMYNETAIEISRRFSSFDFSMQGLYSSHYFPVLIGIIYIFTIPQMIVGQLFIVWLSGISSIFLYLLILELGGTKKTSFLILWKYMQESILIFLRK